MENIRVLLRKPKKKKSQQLNFRENEKTQNNNIDSTLDNKFDLQFDSQIDVTGRQSLDVGLGHKQLSHIICNIDKIKLNSTIIITSYGT